MYTRKFKTKIFKYIFKEISLLIKITYFMSWKSYLAQEYSQTKWDTVSCVTIQLFIWLLAGFSYGCCLKIVFKLQYFILLRYIKDCH